MARRRTKSGGRFPDITSLSPKGPFEKLTECLSALPFDHIDEGLAQRSAKHGATTKPLLILRESLEARLLVEELAIRHVEATAIANANPPGFAEIPRMLSRVSILARNLSAAIEDADFLLRVSINVVQSQWSPEDKIDLSSLKRTLVAVGRLAEQSHEHLLRRSGYDAVSIKRVGRTNVANKLFGFPMRTLVFSALPIFNRYSAKKATSAFNGSFHRFVMALHEYATGGEASAEATHRFIKEAVRTSKSLVKLRERLAVIEGAFEKQSRTKSANSSKPRRASDRLTRLQLEQQELSQEISRLCLQVPTSTTWPAVTELDSTIEVRHDRP